MAPSRPAQATSLDFQENPVMNETRLNKPHSPTDLFLSFSALSLRAFGGVMAFTEEMVVEKKRWLTKTEFLEEWAVAQTMPGAPVMNLSIMIGSRHFGVNGALAGLTGVLILPLILVFILVGTFAYFGRDPHLVGALEGMGAVSAGLLIATGVKLIKPLRANPLGHPLCLLLGTACFSLIALAHYHLATVLLALGPLACGIVYWKFILISRGK